MIRQTVVVVTFLLVCTCAYPQELARPEARRARASGRAVHKRSGFGRGPDITSTTVDSVSSYGDENSVSAFSVGYRVCNVGDAAVEYDNNTNRHPVLTQGMYRLKDGKFEQLGLSWTYHTFFATQENACGQCLYPDGLRPGIVLGVGCSGWEPGFITGQQVLLAPRSQVNPHTGEFRYPPNAPLIDSIISRRLQVHNADLDPDSNTGARYFVEQLIAAPDDAAAGNAGNNASYREVVVTPYDGAECRVSYCAEETGSTEVEQPAIRVWAKSDPNVVGTEVRVPGEGLFILAAAASDLGNGMWHYEYALYNMNSDRSARAVSVPVPPEVAVDNVGFHDVDYHSGEPYDGTDWPATVDELGVTWATETFDVNANANALRWGTLYNFRFDAGAPPESGQITITLFKPGEPTCVAAGSVVPSAPY